MGRVFDARLSGCYHWNISFTGLELLVWPFREGVVLEFCCWVEMASPVLSFWKECEREHCVCKSGKNFDLVLICIIVPFSLH